MSLTDKLIECLTKAGKQELGIPIVLPSYADSIQEITKWALSGSPIEGRQMWFGVGNSEHLRDSLAPELRNRILPIHFSLIPNVMKRGPTDALLIPTHGFSYADPNVFLSEFWKERGSYQKALEFDSQ